jgi:tetratricopeptide (TPR) repeat protein
MKNLSYKRILVWILLVLGSQKFFAFEPQTLIKEGNELYKKGMYSQAASKYQTVADSGYISSDLFYNLGNAYYKAKDNKSAILYYEKAKLLNPQDKELNYNLSLAKSKTVDKIETIPDLFLSEWIRSFRDSLAVDNWAAISLALFIAGLAGLLVYYFISRINIRKISFWGGSICLTLAVLTYLFAESAHNSQIKQRTAIVFIKAVTVKSTPSETGTNLFILHEGTKVKIIDKVDTWQKIKIPDGNQGWVKESDIAKI